MWHLYNILYVKSTFRRYLQLRGLVSQAGSLFSISSHGISDNGFFTCARNAIKIDLFRQQHSLYAFIATYSLKRITPCFFKL